MACIPKDKARPGGAIEACALMAALAAGQATTLTATAHRAIGAERPASRPSSFRHLADMACGDAGETSSPASLPWRFSLPYAALA